MPVSLVIQVGVNGATRFCDKELKLSEIWHQTNTLDSNNGRHLFIRLLKNSTRYNWLSLAGKPAFGPMLWRTTVDRPKKATEHGCRYVY